MPNEESEYGFIEELISLIRDQRDGNRPDFSYGTKTAREIKRLIDEIPGGFLIYRANGNEEILYANQALIRMFRCEGWDDFLQHTKGSFRGIVSAEDLDAVEASIWEQIGNSQDDLDYCEYRIVTKDGDLRWVEDYGHFVHTDCAGDIFYVFITDATEKINRRLTERAALINEGREKEARLLNLIEEYDKERKLIRQEHLQRLEVIEGLSVNYESILYADLDTGIVLPYRLSTRLFLQFDKKYEVRDFDQFAKDYVAISVHPEDRAFVAERISKKYIREHLCENPTYYFNYRSIEEGATKYLQVRLVNVGEERVSKIVFGCRSVDDEIIQEIKQKQLLADALEAAKLADVAKNTFLSNMSHDLRTPLNAIFGYTALAKKYANSPCEAVQYLDKIEDAGNQILRLIEKILAFTYLESGESRLTEEACNVADLLSEIVESVRPAANRKSLAFTSHAPAFLPEVYADREKLKQLILAVVNNAVTYTNAGGSVSVAVKAETSSDFATYRFIVKDTGIGIPKEEIERIFLPFERLNNTTHSGEYGTGLGLTIAKHICEMMGGTIGVESELGKGSAFTVTVCLRIFKQKEREEKQIPLQGKKILLVEDNEINREIQTELLADAGFLVETAENGKIAVEILKRARAGEYALVLMDIQMPVMDGRTATTIIRNFTNPKIANIPIIALSANAFESDIRASMECGMNAHLPKPMDVPLLLRTISQILN